ncbi:hypothetical protein FB451DRAFT_1401433 [Mycena latifolia]|nr:hypothetical protein FB451DRAFT_1401433 [Mycena latifolia]
MLSNAAAPDLRLNTIDPTLRPTPAGSAAPTVPTVVLPGPVKRKYDDMVAVLDIPAAKSASKRRKRAAKQLEEQQQSVKAFDLLFSIIPDLLDVVKQLYLDIPTKPVQWDNLIDLMRSAVTAVPITAATSAQTETGGLKHCLEYGLPNPTKDVFDPLIIKNEIKSDRGVVNLTLRYLILPWSLRRLLPPLAILPHPPSITTSRDMDEDASATAACNDFLARLAGNNLDLTAAEVSAFCYEEGTYDPENMDHGLLHSHLLLRVLWHMWTTPSSALFGLEDGLSPRSNAKYHGVFQVLPEMIGCAAIQARTMIATDDWKRQHGSYNYEELFNTIVNLLADPDDPWVEETLAWFQSIALSSRSCIHRARPGLASHRPVCISVLYRIIASPSALHHIESSRL